MSAVFKGQNVVFSGGVVRPATIIVTNGKITEIRDGYQPGPEESGLPVVCDAGTLHLMAGLVDCHVHVNEPGRTDWEGFWTATQAAAAGGISAIIDMPLNSLPSTVTRDSFREKLESTRDKYHVDVGFWGGVVPRNQTELLPMLEQGVCGFKCFMIDSGVDEFHYVKEADIRSALQQLQGTSSVLMFHAEDDSPGLPDGAGSGDPRVYNTFLETRPDSWEVAAIDTVCRLCLEYRVRCHIVHLATAEALPLIEKAKQYGAPLTVETTHHYLSLEAETVPDGATQYKCCPPIRSKANQAALWDAVKSGLIDMVVSDHSPCTPDLKLPVEGDFLKAWGGIASVQFGLSLFWTGCKTNGLGLGYVTKNLCESPAKLGGVEDRKGRIAVGMDADFVVWDPNDKITITPGMIYHKNKITPYLEKSYLGKVHETFVRGQRVYSKGHFADKPLGQVLTPVATSK